VVTHAVYNTSIVTLVIATRLAGMDRTLEEASADLGATPFGTFWRVTLPQLYPAILAGALLSGVIGIDNFLARFAARDTSGCAHGVSELNGSVRAEPIPATSNTK